jgi:hypothetical protein
VYLNLKGRGVRFLLLATGELEFLFHEPKATTLADHKFQESYRENPTPTN